MTEDDKAAAPSATNHGSGNHISSPTITVSIGGAGVKALIGALVGVAIILLLTVPVARGADQKADFTTKEQERFEKRLEARLSGVEAEARITQYWDQRLAISCEANGVKVPPLPFGHTE